MLVDGTPYRTIFPAPDGRNVMVIDQTALPFRFALTRLETVEQAAEAISTMVVRGAPLIGATAAHGVTLALETRADDGRLAEAVALLAATRPTAVNLRWALERMRAVLAPLAPADRLARARAEAAAICDEDAEQCRRIGQHGAALIRDMHARTGRVVNVLTHCNAGWLATVDWGTALAPIYRAHDEGVPVHVFVDETRPRNQGAALTAWELGAHGVPHTLIADNAGGHLMQRGVIDMCIVGSDRTAANGDVANKIGTYLKALAAHDTGVPFYAALPVSTIDWSIADGVRDIPIEERAAREVTHMTGLTESGTVETVRVAAPGTPACNPAFDVTPARLVTGIITERGLAPASRAGLAALYPDLAGEAA